MKKVSVKVRNIPDRRVIAYYDRIARTAAAKAEQTPKHSTETSTFPTDITELPSISTDTAKTPVVPADTTTSPANELPQAPPQSRPRPPSVWKELGGLGLKISVLVGAVAILFTFFYGFHRTTDPDMGPMVRTGDLVLFYRLNRTYAVGDLILLDFQGERQVRRIVARAGDTVDIIDGSLIVNGATQQEPNIFQETWRYENGVPFPLTVGERQVFVLGDAREGATDSRVYGPVNIDDTLGSVITVIRRRNL
ncbi:MAG: signal peptidase I [Oscillospiraceae bacterium]|nr:signal peptidase I [Oscillospiraceae bacterium]